MVYFMAYNQQLFTVKIIIMNSSCICLGVFTESEEFQVVR